MTMIRTMIYEALFGKKRRKNAVPRDPLPGLMAPRVPPRPPVPHPLATKQEAGPDFKKIYQRFQQQQQRKPRKPSKPKWPHSLSEGISASEKSVEPTKPRLDDWNGIP